MVGLGQRNGETANAKRQDAYGGVWWSIVKRGGKPLPCDGRKGASAAVAPAEVRRGDEEDGKT
ncbi:hypothetical protein A2U01_0109880, partial [Trifolium medium]|nr:hypothetical protein [Trifolium medium]